MSRAINRHTWTIDVAPTGCRWASAQRSRVWGFVGRAEMRHAAKGVSPNATTVTVNLQDTRGCVWRQSTGMQTIDLALHNVS